MKTKRWMKSVLAQSAKDQVDLPWARKLRVGRRAEKGKALRAAS